MNDLIVLLPLQRHYLRFSEHLTCLGNVSLQRSESVLKRFEITAQPNRAHTGRSNEDAALTKFVRNTNLPEGWLLECKGSKGRFSGCLDSIT